MGFFSLPPLGSEPFFFPPSFHALFLSYSYLGGTVPAFLAALIWHFLVPPGLALHTRFVLAVLIGGLSGLLGSSISLVLGLYCAAIFSVIFGPVAFFAGPLPILASWGGMIAAIWNANVPPTSRWMRRALPIGTVGLVVALNLDYILGETPRSWPILLPPIWIFLYGATGLALTALLPPIGAWRKNKAAAERQNDLDQDRAERPGL